MTGDRTRRASRRASFLTAALLLGTAPAIAQSAAQPEIDLKLFEKAEVDRSKGCSVVLWQANRDPVTDKFAYLFTEVLTGQNHARQPARIKIAGQVVTLTRVATGGKSTGYGLYPYQLYKLSGPDDFVVLELKLAAEDGESVDVDSGTMSIIMKGRQVFRASVKGNAGCYTAAAAPAKRTEAPAPNNDMAGMFERYAVRPQQVPAALRAAAAKQFGCEAKVLQGAVTGFQMSEESAIWQIPCGDYGGSKSAVFALVYLTDPTKNYGFIPFKFPKGQNRNLGDHAMMEPKWDLKARIVSSTYTEGNGKDCGSVERHRVTAEGGFQLIELKAREQCDGKAVGAENFPVVFKLR
jgi:hypothetical protein